MLFLIQSLILIVIISFCNFVTYCDGFSDMPLYREPTRINCPAPSLQWKVLIRLNLQKLKRVSFEIE